MKQQTGNSIKLGIFVTIGVALFAAGIFFIGQRQQFFGSTFRVKGIFRDISGLQVGNNVRFAGINVGIVEEIEQISDTTVRVDMLIESKTQKFIKKNAKVIIGSDGLMGNKLILISPGSGIAKQIANNDYLETARPVSLDDILIKLKTTSDNAAEITDGLSAIIGNIRSGNGTIGKLFMDTAFAEDLALALSNIKQGAGGFKQNMTAASHNFFLKGYLKKETKNKEKDDKVVK